MREGVFYGGGLVLVLFLGSLQKSVNLGCT